MMSRFPFRRAASRVTAFTMLTLLAAPAWAQVAFQPRVANGYYGHGHGCRPCQPHYYAPRPGCPSPAYQRYPGQPVPTPADGVVPPPMGKDPMTPMGKDPMTPMGKDPMGMDPMGMGQNGMDPGAGQPPADQGASTQDAAAATASLASASGAASAPSSVAPNSIGDFIGSPSVVCFFSPSIYVPVGDPGRGRRFRIADNQNPLPQNRVFFNYNHFSDALVATDGDDPLESYDVNRFVFGAESTFWCGAGSIQIQVPFSSTLASDLSTDDLEDDEATELDNISLVTKFLLHRDCCTAVSAGLGIDLPTADDVFVEIDDQSYEISNDAVLLHPYLAVLHTPCPCSFWQFYVQLSLAAGENEYEIDDDSGDISEGERNPGSYLHLDLTYGFWLYRNMCACHLKGIAPMVELHYTRTIDEPDAVDGGDVEILTDDIDYLNLTVGCEFLVGCTTIRPAMVVPLLDDDEISEETLVPNQPFDWEFVLQVNRFF